MIPETEWDKERERIRWEHIHSINYRHNNEYATEAVGVDSKNPLELSAIEKTYINDAEGLRIALVYSNRGLNTNWHYLYLELLCRFKRLIDIANYNKEFSDDARFIIEGLRSELYYRDKRIKELIECQNSKG